MRIRTIKPQFFMNEELAQCNPVTRLLFIGLWCAADREGRLEDRPTRLKAEILPYDPGDVNEMLNCLAKRGFILRYEVDGKRFILVLRFKDHQRITGTEAERASVYPAPKEGTQPPLNLELDDVPPPPKSVNHKEEREIIDFLNQQTGMNFRHVDTNLKLVRARLDEPGVDVPGIKTMICRKVREWKGGEMEKYLRPETLFGKTKFEGYYASKDSPVSGRVEIIPPPEEGPMPPSVETPGARPENAKALFAPLPANYAKKPFEAEV